MGRGGLDRSRWRVLVAEERSSAPVDFLTKFDRMWGLLARKWAAEFRCKKQRVGGELGSTNL